jgi:hypothetical protein
MPSFTPCDPLELVSRASEELAPQELGKLVAVLSDWLLGGSHRATLKLIVHAGVADLLTSSEFLEGLGAGRLKSKQLLRLAFKTHAASPGGAVAMIERLAAAGAVNPFSSSALAALHDGMRGWRFVEPKAALLVAIVSSFDTFAQAGLFLSLLLESPASGLGAEEVPPLLEAVLADGDVRDLAGDTGDLLAALPDYADVVEDALARAHSEDGASEADEDGNLAGFVDDEIVFDSDAGSGGSDDEDNSDADSDSDDDSGDSGSDGSRGGGAAVAAAGRKRPRAASDSDGSDAGKAAPAPARRLRRAGDAPAGPAPSPKGAAAAASGRGRGRGGAAAGGASRYVDAEAGMGAGSDDDTAGARRGVRGASAAGTGKKR